MRCPACGGRSHEQVATQVYRCRRCQALHGTVYRGELSQYVVLEWASGPVPPDRERYFDFTVLGSSGVTRVHGWYDVESRRLTQVG